MSFDKIPPRTYTPFQLNKDSIQPFFAMLRERKLTNTDIGDARQFTKQPIKEEKANYSNQNKTNKTKRYKRRIKVGKVVKQKKKLIRKQPSNRLEKKIRKAKI